MSAISIVAIIVGSFLLTVVIQAIFEEIIERRAEPAMNTHRPRQDGVPSDLPPWARDELVRRRLEASDMLAEIYRLRMELVRQRGGSIGEEFAEIMRRVGS